MHNGICWVVGVVLGVAAMTGWALQHPQPLSGDQRLEVVNFVENNVVPIVGATFTTTQIVFAKNEWVQNVQNGDLGAWTVSIDKHLPNMMFIKPTVYDSNTNMTVVTNAHTYYFNLQSVKRGEHPKRLTYAIKFVYPDQQVAKLTQALRIRAQQRKAEQTAWQHPEQYHWEYSFHGDKRLVPVHVFDDGQFTYMQLRPNQPVPAVFAVHDYQGTETMVNYRRDGRYLIIDQVAPQFTLRAGQHAMASLFNQRSIDQLLREEV